MSDRSTVHSLPTATASVGGASARSLWHVSAPETVRRAYRSLDDAGGWAVWREYLAARRGVPGLRKMLGSSDWPLAWALPQGLALEGSLEEPVGRRAATGNGKVRPARIDASAKAWLARADAAERGAQFALEGLAWCHAMPRMAAELTPQLWWRLFDALLAAAEPGDDGLKNDPLTHQLLAGELGLVLARVFPEIVPCRRRAVSARRALTRGLIELLDGEGLLHARHLDQLAPLMACWTRCRALGSDLPQGCWSAAAEHQYAWLVRQSLRLARADGSPAFSSLGNGRGAAVSLKVALRLGGDSQDRQIARIALGRKKPAAGRKGTKLPSPAVHSEWAAAAVLRSGWERAAPSLAVGYPGTEVRTELHCGGEVLWSGPWDVELRRDGRRARPTSDWEEVCWVSDGDGDYLELEIQLEGGLRVERQMLLARREGFLFLADAVLGTVPGELEYRSCLRLAPGVAFRGAKSTREGRLVCAGNRCRAVAMPLALPEWRVDPRVGTLQATAEGLELAQRARGRCLYAPLWLDLDARRMNKPRTWRQLTVGEDLAAQPAEVAAGYRVMSGGHQWLIYRALASKGNRTLLGHNLVSETLVGRFRRDGEVESLVEIE